MAINKIKKLANLPVANLKKIGGLSTQYVKKVSGIVYDAFPLSIPGIKLWLDASKIEGLSDGNAITTWNDASANGVNPTQATAAQKPTYKTNIINGLPVARYDGGDILAASITLPTFITMFVVSGNATNGKTFFIEQGPNTNTNNGFFFYGEGVSIVNTYRSGMHETSKAGWFGNSWAVASFTYDGSFLIYKNGTQVTGNTTSGSSRSNSDVTDNLYVGARTGLIVPMQADLAEVLIYSGKLADTDRQAVEDYLKTKYGL